MCISDNILYLRPYNNGDLISGVIGRISSNGFSIDINELYCNKAMKCSFFLKKAQMMNNDQFFNGKGVRCAVESIEYEEKRGLYNVNVSRTSRLFVQSLMKEYIPECKNGLIEIKSVSRIPGIISKVSVSSIYDKIDPVGACIGQRGSRIVYVSKEINGEKIDIIKWDQDPIKHLLNSLHSYDVHVEDIRYRDDENSTSIVLRLDRASVKKFIGRSGRIVRVLEKLIGMTICVSENNEISDYCDHIPC